jgi:hypothetical protein
LIGDQLVVGWALKGQEGGKEALHLGRPCLVMVSTGGAYSEGRGVTKPSESKTEEMGTADL